MKIRTVFITLLSILLIANVSYSAQKEVLLKTTSTWDNVKYNRLKIKNPEVTVLKINIGINEALSLHKHDLVNVAYVKKGTLTVYTDKNEHITVKEGECLPEIIGKYHYGKNTGDEPVELIVFYIGECGTPLSVNK
ncbi:cupin domain-containing protein [bacterium]|nr:cupin domain-containing protein [bacterium]